MNPAITSIKFRKLLLFLEEINDTQLNTMLQTVVLGCARLMVELIGILVNKKCWSRVTIEITYNIFYSLHISFIHSHSLKYIYVMLYFVSRVNNDSITYICKLCVYMEINLLFCSVLKAIIYNRKLEIFIGKQGEWNSCILILHKLLLKCMCLVNVKI